MLSCEAVPNTTAQEAEIAGDELGLDPKLVAQLQLIAAEELAPVGQSDESMR